MERIIECVPNFSEGRDGRIINAIADAICSEKNVRLLHIDSGEAANRTVYTFVGSPEDVVNAAFNAVRCASVLIDMRKHHGTHPRTGACDVLPLIPISGITLEECAQIARDLAKRILDELGIPSYCYEAAAFTPERRNLAVCREGEYESLAEKIADPKLRPDFCTGKFTEVVARSGAINIGARDFLIAVNFNLNTDDVKVAKSIALEVREKAHQAKDAYGNKLYDKSGLPIMVPGLLPGCKAIGWYIEEYGIAQVSMNITDISKTKLHEAYEQACKSASTRSVSITGTEIIGLVPKSVLVEAGNFYLSSRGTANATDDMLFDAAIKSMGLDDLRPFNVEEKVIELARGLRR